MDKELACILMVVAGSLLVLNNSQYTSAHEVFTEPFTLNYTSLLRTNGDLNIFDYDSNTKLWHIRMHEDNNTIDKTFKITEDDDHVLRDSIHKNRILDLNLTDSYCSDPEICNLLNLKINTQDRSVNLEWTSDSGNTLALLKQFNKQLVRISNGTSNQ